MPTTVQQVADEALQNILVAGSEASLGADDLETFMFGLNKWMATLTAMGLNLGYTAVSNASDILTVPDGAIDPIISNMAIKMAPQFAGVVSPELREDAKEGMRQLRIIGISINSTKYPETLPVGSGNWWNWGPNYYGGKTP